MTCFVLLDDLRDHFYPLTFVIHTVLCVSVRYNTAISYNLYCVMSLLKNFHRIEIQSRLRDQSSFVSCS